MAYKALGVFYFRCSIQWRVNLGYFRGLVPQALCATLFVTLATTLVRVTWAAVELQLVLNRVPPFDPTCQKCWCFAASLESNKFYL